VRALFGPLLCTTRPWLALTIDHEDACLFSGCAFYGDCFIRYGPGYAWMNTPIVPSEVAVGFGASSESLGVKPSSAELAREEDAWQVHALPDCHCVPAADDCCALCTLTRRCKASCSSTSCILASMPDPLDPGEEECPACAPALQN
jgi:hypothetical protein